MNETLRRLMNEATERQDRADDTKRKRKAEAFKEAVQQYLRDEVLASFDNVTFGYDMSGSFLTFRAEEHDFEIRQGPMNADFLINLSIGRQQGKKPLLFTNLKEENAKDRILRTLRKALADAEQQPKAAPQNNERRLKEGGMHVVIAPDLIRTFPNTESVNEALHLLKRIAECTRGSS